MLEKQTTEVDKKDEAGNVITNPDGTTAKKSTQTIAQGPVASQEFIKEWGTNGGGFFNANSSHPFENPTPFSNLIEMFAIFAISAGLTYTLGQNDRLTKTWMGSIRRNGISLFCRRHGSVLGRIEWKSIVNRYRSKHECNAIRRQYGREGNSIWTCE